MPTTRYKAEDGARLRSVSGIAGDFGDKGGLTHAAWKLGMEGRRYRDVWGMAARLGSSVHEVAELYWSGKTLDDAVEQVSGSVPDEVLDEFGSCCAGFARALMEVQFGTVHALEKHMVSEAHRYGGTPDAILDVNGNAALLDIKTGAIYPDMALQLAAYRCLWNETRGEDEPEVVDAYLLQLSKVGGGYALKQVPGEVLDTAWKVFLCVHRAGQFFATVKKGMEG